MVEYEECILGIDEAIDLRIKISEVYRDYVLVINQIKGEWGTHNAKLIRYRDHVQKMIAYFNEITSRESTSRRLGHFIIHVQS